MDTKIAAMTDGMMRPAPPARQSTNNQAHTELNFRTNTQAPITPPTQILRIQCRLKMLEERGVLKKEMRDHVTVHWSRYRYVRDDRIEELK